MEKAIKVKPRILFINSVCGFGSTGRIVADLSKMDEFETLVCFGRKKDYANVNSYKFSNFFDNALGAFETILFDNNLNLCNKATKRLINKIKEFNPDIIHLHNLHGYYVNIEMLFKFLKEYKKPVVWTLHDCWSFTGYCPSCELINCEKYKEKCCNCAYGFAYPFSLFKQNVDKDFILKKELFNSINNLTIVTPSKWMSTMVENSYLKNHRIEILNNGIHLNDFKPTKSKNSEFTVLAVSNYWSPDKGGDELNKVIPLLDKNIKVIVVGSGSDKINNCIALKRTNNKKELIDLYSSSHILINPTLEDNFPTVNIESLACGTPVITYDTGGSPEIIDDKTGIVVKKYDYKSLAEAINNSYNNYNFDAKDCVERAKLFSSDLMVKKYGEIYESLLAM